VPEHLGSRRFERLVTAGPLPLGKLLGRSPERPSARPDPAARAENLGPCVVPKHRCADRCLRPCPVGYSSNNRRGSLGNRVQGRVPSGVAVVSVPKHVDSSAPFGREPLDVDVHQRDRKADETRVLCLWGLPVPRCRSTLELDFPSSGRQTSCRVNLPWAATPKRRRVQRFQAAPSRGAVTAMPRRRRSRSPFGRTSSGGLPHGMGFSLLPRQRGLPSSAWQDLQARDHQLRKPPVEPSDLRLPSGGCLRGLPSCRCRSTSIRAHLLGGCLRAGCGQALHDCRPEQTFMVGPLHDGRTSG
jgi:hypothetical protein